jgi:PAS domain S-box-containing protein
MAKLAKLGVVPALVLAVAIVVFVVFDFLAGYAFNPPNLLLALNVVFIGGTNMAVAVLSAKGYLDQGSPNVLVLGCAVLVSGLAALSAGWASGFSANANVTIFNVSLLAAAGLQVLAASLTSSGSGSKFATKVLLLVSYSAVGVFVLLLSALTLDGFLPTFFTATGPTVIREFVLVTAGLLFGVACIVYVRLLLKSKSIVLYWYALALSTVAMGLLGSLFVTEFSGPLAWITRLGQYMGGFYFLFAVLALRNVGFSAGWAEAFAADRRQIATFFSKMLNSFTYSRVLTDSDGKPVDYVFLEVNDAFEKSTGLKRSDVIGKRATQVLPGIDRDSTDWIGIFGKVASTGEPMVFQGYSKQFDKWFEVSAYSPKKGHFVSLFENITESKKAEETVRSIALFPSENPYPVFRLGQDGTVLYSNPAGLSLLNEWKCGVGQATPEHWRQLVRDVFKIGVTKGFDETHGERTVSYLFVPLVESGYVNVYGRDITERKKLEEDLKGAAEKYASIVNTTSDGVWIHNLKGEIIEVNDAYCHMSGYTREELVGIPISALEAVESPAEIAAHIERVLENGGHDRFESKHRRKDGSVFDVDITAVYLEREGGRMAIFVRDIAERKRIEEELKAGEERYRHIVQYAPTAIYEIDYTGPRFRSVNDVMCQMSGYTREELLAKNPYEMLDAESQLRFKERIRKASAGERLDENVEYKAITKDGRELWVTLDVKPTGKNGKIDGALVVAHDVTERRQLQDKLEEYAKNLEGLVEERTSRLAQSFRYTRNLIETSLDPLVTISAEGKITDVNEATVQATGYTREELVGSNFSNYFTEPEKAESGYKRVFTEGFVKDYPLAIRHKSGKTTDVLYNAAVYRNETGDIQGVFAAARDITELKRAEEFADESLKKLKESERLAAIGTTAGMVGHDIRNPLQSIIGDIYLVKSDLTALTQSEEKASIKDSLEAIEKSVDYINKIVSDLQDYARPLIPVPKRTDLEETVEDSIKKNEVPESIVVASRVDKTVRRITTDPDLLMRILGNLVSNAVQAMPDGGKLTIRAFHEANDVVVTVQDTGVGIPKQIQPKIFAPLFTTKSKGQGFGLAVVKRLTEALGGIVTFESEEGKGTKFIVRLPQKK